MRESSLEYVISILKGERPKAEAEWYETLGFMYAHRIAGLFYKRAERLEIPLPPKAEKLLKETYEKQKRRTEYMREETKKLSLALIAELAEHIFLKGSVLSNLTEESAIYADGERVSNDIDILVRQAELNVACEALKKQGFVQGRYESKLGKVIPFSRTEVLKRRMTRGETAPFLKATENPEEPYLEVDINFSLGNEPGEKDALLAEMLETRKLYAGKTSVYVSDEEMFFLYLVLHQYKESALYFTAARGKDLDLYKLADIYYLWRAEAFDKERLKALSVKYGLKREIGAVLSQVGKIFNDTEIVTASEEYGGLQPEVYDYERKKRYRWTAGVSERIRIFDGKAYLREKKENVE